MKLECYFKGASKSNKLTELTETRLQLLNHFDFPVTGAHVTFQKNKHLRQVEAVIKVDEKIFKAIATAESFVQAIDAVVDKLSRQLAKLHSKMSDKRNPMHSKHGKLLQLRETLEFQPLSAGFRKQSKAA